MTFQRSKLKSRLDAVGFAGRHGTSAIFYVRSLARGHRFVLDRDARRPGYADVNHGIAMFVATRELYVGRKLTC